MIYLRADNNVFFKVTAVTRRASWAVATDPPSPHQPPRGHPPYPRPPTWSAVILAGAWVQAPTHIIPQVQLYVYCPSHVYPALRSLIDIRLIHALPHGRRLSRRGPGVRLQ